MDNQKLQEFQSRLKALLKEYDVALDVKTEIVAVDLSAIREQADETKKAEESVGLVGN